MALTDEQYEQIRIANPFNFTLGIKNEAGLPLDYGNRPFMKAILEDVSPLQVILKAPQVGATVLQTIKAFWVANYLKKDIIYTLPTQSDVIDMVGGKINRIIAQNPILQEMIKDHDTIEQKLVGNNIIYFRGTFTSKAATMVSSQLNLHDEVDSSNPQTLIQYETRQQAQMGGWRWYFSHPSIVGNGIDAYWQKSDQKEWFIHCDYCDKWQFMEWPLSVNQEMKIYCCKFCGAHITDKQRRMGEWRKRFPEAEFSGYHIPQLICPWIPAEKIIKDFKEKEPQYFHNFVLALPYADTQSKITLETIKGLLSDKNERKGRILIGLDTGLKLRIFTGDMLGGIETQEFETYEELQRYCDKFKDWMMMADPGGDIIGVRKFAEDNKGKVFFCYFRQDKKSLNLFTWGKKEEYGIVWADRNRLIQLVVDEMNDKRYTLEGDLAKWWNFWLHCSHIFRTVEEDRVGNLVYVWQRTDRDDYLLACCYWRVLYERFAEQNSSFEGRGELDDLVPEAPVTGETHIKITMPEVPRKSDDWRFN